MWVEGTCSKTCGFGVRLDQRRCTTPDHQECCTGGGLRQRNCSIAECPGIYIQILFIALHPKCKYMQIDNNYNILYLADPHPIHCQYLFFPVFDFAVHGGWSRWVEATPCSASCGGGTQVLVRECNEPVPAHGGKDCAGKPFIVDPCNSCPCKPRELTNMPLVYSYLSMIEMVQLP